MKYLIIVGMLLASVTAYAQFNGCPAGFCNLSASGTPASDNALLLEDGTNYLLLEDGVSTLCLESGC